MANIYSTPGFFEVGFSFADTVEGVFEEYDYPSVHSVSDPKLHSVLSKVNKLELLLRCVTMRFKVSSLKHRFASRRKPLFVVFCWFWGVFQQFGQCCNRNCDE